MYPQENYVQLEKIQNIGFSPQKPEKNELRLI